MWYQRFGLRDLQLHCWRWWWKVMQVALCQPHYRLKCNHRHIEIDQLICFRMACFALWLKVCAHLVNSSKLGSQTAAHNCSKEHQHDLLALIAHARHWQALLKICKHICYRFMALLCHSNECGFFLCIAWLSGIIRVSDLSLIFRRNRSQSEGRLLSVSRILRHIAGAASAAVSYQETVKCGVSC